MSERAYRELADGRADVLSFLRDHAALTNSASVLLTYSSKYGFPSMSGFVTGAQEVQPGSEAVREWLEELDRYSARSGDISSAVLGFIQDSTGIMARLATPAPVRPGEIGVAIAIAEGTRGDAAVSAIVQSIMASRSVMFHVENGIDYALRQAVAPGSALQVDVKSLDLEHLERSLHTARLNRLIEDASRSIGIGSLRVFEASDAVAIATTPWYPTIDVDAEPEFALLEDVATPPPPVAGEHVELLSALIQASWRRRRRFTGIVEGQDERFLVITIPYGVDIRSDRPAGVLCHAVRYQDAASVGRYEMVFEAHLATWLARVAAERRLATTVANLAEQLAVIANTGRSGPSSLVGNEVPLYSTGVADPVGREFLRCDDRLRTRADVRALLESLPHMFSHLRRLSSASSCTFRLLTGDDHNVEADPSREDRWLRRVYSDGEDEWNASPWALAVSSCASSVNAWVARHGVPVYLRELPENVTQITRATCRELERYPGLESVAMYRTGIRSELCVPVFAEGRLVGTLNIESSRVGAFDEVALSVLQYAQVVGVTLLEARRRIAVDVMDTAGGFLDVRHEIDSRLERLQDRLTSEYGASTVPDLGFLVDEISSVQEMVFLKPGRSTIERDMTVSQIIGVALKNAKSAYASLPPEEFLAEPSDAIETLFDEVIPPNVAGPLCYALSQAFYNVRKHGEHRFERSAEEQRGWHNPIRLHVYELIIGGIANLIIRVDTLLKAAHGNSIDTARLFREPLVDAEADRLSMGAYLAGEVLRRCGGSAFARLIRLDERSVVLQVEFAVPAGSKKGGLSA